MQNKKIKVQRNTDTCVCEVIEGQEFVCQCGLFGVGYQYDHKIDHICVNCKSVCNFKDEGAMEMYEVTEPHALSRIRKATRNYNLLQELKPLIYKLDDKELEYFFQIEDKLNNLKQDGLICNDCLMKYENLNSMCEMRYVKRIKNILTSNEKIELQ